MEDSLLPGLVVALRPAPMPQFRVVIMRKVATTSLTSIAMLVVVGAVATWGVISSHEERHSNAPYGSVVFLGYTNDRSGAQLTTFAITNASDITVVRHPYCVISIQGRGSGWTDLMPVPLSGSSRKRVLGPGMSEIVTIAPPPNLSPWRISIYLSNDVGPTWPLKRLLNAACALVGRSEPYGWTTCQIDSSRIDNQR
jgi:hypothetical protein